MKGKDLIKWIQNNNAEDLNVLIEARDSGGSYGEYLPPEPCIKEELVSIDINNGEGVYLEKFLSL